jgi:[ribosomal protein S5]-alanine N-acetyltransferase
MINLAPITECHLPDVQIYAADPGISRMSKVPSPYPPDGAAEWFRGVAARRMAKTGEVFCVTHDEQFCGVISLNAAKADWSVAHVDYWIAVPFHGMGLGTTAVELTINHASSEIGVRQLLSTCLAANIASSRVLLKNGFQEREPLIAETGRFAGRVLRRFYLNLSSYDHAAFPQSTQGFEFV